MLTKSQKAGLTALVVVGTILLALMLFTGCNSSKATYVCHEECYFQGERLH